MALVRDVVGGVAFVAVGAAIVASAVQYDIGSPRAPGPGFLGLGLGIMILATSAMTLVSGLRSTETALPGGKPFPNLLGNASVVIAVIVYASVVEGAGYLPSTALFLFCLFTAAFERRWTWRPVAYAAIGTFCTWGLFAKLLKVGLPRGSWFY